MLCIPFDHSIYRLIRLPRLIGLAPLSGAVRGFAYTHAGLKLGASPFSFMPRKLTASTSCVEAGTMPLDKRFVFWSNRMERMFQREEGLLWKGRISKRILSIQSILDR